MKRVMLLLLVLAMLISTVALLGSCGGGNEKTGGESKESEGPKDELDYLPDKKYTSANNGKFVVLCRDNGQEILRETSEGDRVDYAIYMRNATIEERYGVELTYSQEEYHLIPDKVSDIVKAGDTSAIDVINNHIVYSSNIMTAGDALNWQEVPYIDLTQDWWARSNLKDLTLNNQTYILIGDMHTSAIGSTYCMFYNKKLCEKYNITGLYELVMNDGAWTYEKMLDLISDIREDVNKDNRYNAHDLYGLVTTGGSPVNAYLWAFDNPIFAKNSEGELEFTFYSSKLTSLMTKLVKLYHKTDGCFSATQDLNAVASMFVDERAVFINGMFSMAASQLRDMDVSMWGIVPYPKWNSKQQSYLTSVDGGHNALVAPYLRNASDEKVEMLGVITEALNCLSHSGLRVEYYDKALKSKYIGDPKEAAVIDMLMENRVFDFGYIYLAFTSPAFWLQDMIPAKNDKIANYYAGKKDALEAKIVEVYAAYGLEFEGLD